MNKKFEYDMFHLSNEIHDRKTGEIQDDTKEILLGTIKDDFENKKEIFISTKDIGKNKQSSPLSSSSSS